MLSEYAICPVCNEKLKYKRTVYTNNINNKIILRKNEISNEDVLVHSQAIVECYNFNEEIYYKCTVVYGDLEIYGNYVQEVLRVKEFVLSNKVLLKDDFKSFEIYFKNNNVIQFEYPIDMKNYKEILALL